ncbi:PhnD/SsuA/transferrin family substrate-binding protein [Shewanella sp. ULN5]|uniref:sensor histidine kinase n=1 Tax=Shewanella sp. ULN5 TaxID=2994678 RepID=UPI00273F97ED|nr:PhnD/SsuA/transferrin family substrate-binding protein [Shewanella sp. ULN5]MDP5148290.1 PhnD/SsuA/transferrin family substrate-binding protein [Shewanella sp. ULN5]
MLIAFLSKLLNLLCFSSLFALAIGGIAFANGTNAEQQINPLSTPLLTSDIVATPSEAQIPHFTVGALAFSSDNAVYERWAPTLKRVTEQTGIPISLVTLTPIQLVEKVEADQLDFIISNALISVALKKDYGVTNLLSLVPQNTQVPELAVGSTLIARTDVSIQRLADLRPLRIISSDPNAFGGFQIMAGEMIDKGINPLKDFANLNFIGFPQNKLLTEVLYNRADIAILPSCVLEAAISEGLIPENKLHVLLPKAHSQFNCETSSQLYPSSTFSKLGHTDHKIATKIVKALLEIQPGDSEAIAGRYHNWSSPVRDNHVYTLLEKLKRWPFVTNWQRLLQDVTPWFIFICIILLLGYLHHLRVKRLVVNRTQALSNEMAMHQHTQKTLFAQQQQFYRAQRVLLTGEMASGIAHELNQPLAGIRYLTQGCIYRLGEEQQDIKNALNKTILQVDRAQSTIKRFREFCHQPSDFNQLDLRELVDDTLKLMEPDFKRLKLEPQLELSSVMVNCDASLMQQVLVNLLRNALDSLEESHSALPQEKMQLTIRLFQHDKAAQIAITDSGTGLPKAALERLFFPFETSKNNGLGLGMVVCKRIIEEHGGKIRAFNNQQKDKYQFGEFSLPIKGLTIAISIPIEVM